MNSGICKGNYSPWPAFPLTRFARQVLIATLAALSAGTWAWADSPSDAFARITILDNGRLKPIDTYARSKLLQLSGKRRCPGKSATTWLADALFAPDRTWDDKVFLINNPEIADALGIAPEKKRRYSFSALHQGMSKLSMLAQSSANVEPRQRTAFEAEVLRVSGALEEYVALISAFSFCEPMPELTIRDSLLSAHLGLPQDSGISYLDVLSYAPRLAAGMKSLVGKDPAAWSGADSAVVSLSRAMYDMANTTRESSIVVLPVVNGGDVTWMSPWGLVKRLGSSAPDDALLTALIHVQGAYRAGDRDGLDRAVNAFTTAVDQRLAGATSSRNPGLEVLYNKLNPFLFAKIFYGLALILALLAMVITARWLWAGALGLLVLGLIPHTFGIVARMVIMGRPPVTNLYETFVFVAWVCVALGLFVESMERKSLGALIASITGFLFVHLSGLYGSDGDTMGMLAAVLNNNFWLATHIITISLGYAGCLIAGIVGHVYLIQRLFVKDPRPGTETARVMYGMVAFGLTFTFVGTMLGGMWADQAWGRFWGWDPKENGALLIILWCAIVLHARAGKMIHDTGTAVGAIVGLVLVMYAWIGVNLLGVGMHAYGFTSQGATLLLWLTIGEAGFLVGAEGLLRWGKRSHISTPLDAAPISTNLH